MTSCLRKLQIFLRTFSPHCHRCQYSTGTKIKENTLHEDHLIHHYDQELPLQFKSGDPGKVENLSVKVNIKNVHRHDIESEDPVVLALHGMPGHGGDFHNLSLELAKHGIRFIAPDFPGFGKSLLPPNEVYSLDYSPTGKADMLNRILDQLQLERVDVLLSHSAGSFLGFRAAAEIDRIKSAAFLNFLGGYPHRYARPSKGIQWANQLIKNPVTQPLLLKILPQFYQFIGFSDFKTVQSLQIAVENIVTAEYRKILDHVASIKDKKKPAFFAFSTTDKLIETDIPYRILSHVGINDPHITKLCRENNIKESTTENLADLTDDNDWYFKAVQFDRGGHLLHKTQIPEVTKNIIELIHHTRKMENKL